MAEGDSKTKSEVTFTNNCFELIILFHKVSTFLFNGVDFRPRLYSYSTRKQKLEKIDGIPMNYYVDKRARKPYYIYRFASVKLLKKWSDIVRKCLGNSELEVAILQGFFAGEGNLNATSKSRVIRIAQKDRVPFLEITLNNLGVPFIFNQRSRNYVIWGRKNWDIFHLHNIAILHTVKRSQFIDIYCKFKQYHYSRGDLHQMILKELLIPLSSQELSHKFNRSISRICDVLMSLKKLDLVENYRSGSLSYWIRTDQNTIVISSKKQEYLKLLDTYNKVSEISSNLGVCPKSSKRRLQELEKIGLVENNMNLWSKIKTLKKIVIL